MKHDKGQKTSSIWQAMLRSIRGCNYAKEQCLLFDPLTPSIRRESNGSDGRIWQTAGWPVTSKHSSELSHAKHQRPSYCGLIISCRLTNRAHERVVFNYNRTIHPTHRRLRLCETLSRYHSMHQTMISTNGSSHRSSSDD